MKFAACLLVLSAGAGSATLADEPQSPAQTPAAESPAAQTSTQTTSSPTTATGTPASTSEVKQVPGAAAPAPKADKSEAGNGVPTEAEIKQMRGRGYKPVNRNGMLVFCRDEGELGSHFQRTRCNTLKELKDSELNGKEYVNSVQRLADPFKGP
jgi:hypothetical protein